MKLMPLTQGLSVMVDDDDYRDLSLNKWYAHRQGKRIYALRALKRDENGKQKHIKMHRVILGLVDPNILCDHIDGNGLNNQRSNLRICNSSENIKNQGINNANTSGFKGVSFKKANKKWVAQIAVNGKRLHLGLFSNPEDAHESYMRASEKYHGKFARMQ